MKKVDRDSVKVAHLFWDTAPHLERSFAKLIASCWPNSKIYLADNFWLKQNDGLRLKENADWINSLPTGMLGGVLTGNWWRKLGKHRRMRILLLNVLRPMFDFSSILQILRGPKYWVIHGGLPQFLPTMLMFRILGKRVVAIHWGGKYGCWRRLRFLGSWAHRLFKKIFVLMEPELESFRPVVGAEKLAVLTYASLLSVEQIRSRVVQYEDVLPRCLILGNSAWRIEDYPEILDAIQPGDWDKIICMLNYGDEERKEHTDQFVRKYREKFGGAFYAWRETLPYSEYLKLMGGAPFYICAASNQTGMGAIHNALRQGKAVFIRGDNLKWFQSLGFVVYNLDSVKPWSYSNLCKSFPTKAVVEKNIEIAVRFHRQNSPDNWRRTLEDALFD